MQHSSGRRTPTALEGVKVGDRVSIEVAAAAR